MDEARETTLPEGTEVYGDTIIRKPIYIDGIGRATFITVFEFEQDYHAYHRSLFSRRTPEFTTQEIKDWQEAWEIIRNIHSYDFQKIKDKYKMEIFSEDDTHWRHDERDDEVILQGWKGDPINEENWQIMDLFDRLRFGEKNES